MTHSTPLFQDTREEAKADLQWIGSRVSPPTDDIPSPRKRADFPRVFRHERTSANRLGETSRYVGDRNARWCGSRACARLALHRLEEGLADGSSAPGAYREGRRGGQME